MTFILLLYIVLFLFFKKCSSNEQKYILLAFQIQKEKEYSSQEYNSELFILNNFYKNITFDFHIGNPPQKVKGIIINDNLCFELKKEDNLFSYNNFFSYINNKYKPDDSSSISIMNKELRWKKGQYMTLGSELFKFENNNETYNLSILFQYSKEEEIDINEIKNQKYIVKFGINIITGFSGDECPNFITNIRSYAHLNKYLISYSFSNRDNGYLVIGDELYNYSRIYHESQYKAIYTTYYYMISHNKEIIVDSNKNITLNNTYAFLQYDLGVIIGTNEYKKAIDEIFFSKLILEDICRVNIVKLNETDSYYLYICQEKNFNIKLFPKIIFFSRSYIFDFELNYNDLFIKKYDNRYYFLVLFKVNNETNNETKIKDNWIFGEPFYKKYNFTLNLDARMIGFYNPNFDFEEDEEIIDQKIDKRKNKNVSLKIILGVLGFIFILFLMILCFYLGMKIKEGRKQRANELKDENYEYIQDNEGGKNTIIN